MSLAISIIIPAFNIEKYLSACLDSIIGQIDNNLEIIIINDGSTDNTGDIANRHTQQYDFITIVHQTNQGVSAARNRGLIEAKGDYIWFIDGDDLIINDAINLLINIIKAQDVDVIFFNHKEFFNKIDKEQIVNLDLNNITIKNNFAAHLPVLIRQKSLTYSPWDKIVKRQLLLDHNIRFDTDLTYSEDYYWNYQLFKVANTFAYTNQILYFYRKNREQSATTQLSLRHLKSGLQALDCSTDDMMLNYYDDPQLLKALLLYSSQTFFYILPEFYRADELSKKNKTKFYDIYQMYKNNNINLESINAVAKVFERINKGLPWHHTIRLYSQIVSFRRKIQLYLLKKGK